MSDTIELKDKGLKQLLKAFKVLPSIKVGILAGKASRQESGANNATIGAAHEFGTATLPIRSFLRMPLTTKLNSNLGKTGAFTKDQLLEVMRSGSIRVWAEKIAIEAEGTIADAFNTGGFGQWTPSNMLYKDNWQTLIETNQLRESISSEVK